MRVLLNFMHRDGWSVHCLGKDAQTAISPYLAVQSDGTLLRLVRACGASEHAVAEIERKMKQMGRGSIWIEVNELGRKLLRIRA